MEYKELTELLFPNNTDKRTLDEVIKNLENHPDVDAIISIGSDATGMFKPYSDYDIPVILNKNHAKIKSIITYVDNKIAEFYFFESPKLKELMKKKLVDADSQEGKFLEWVQKANIKFDKSGIVGELKKAAASVKIEVSEEYIYTLWHSVNYNFMQNQRYFDSNDKLYHKALGMRLLYSVTEILTAYLAIRKMPWRGEKDAIKYFEVNDPGFYKIFEEYNNSVELSDKFGFYQELADLALAPLGGLVKNKEVLVDAENNNFPENIKKAHDYWTSLSKSV